MGGRALRSVKLSLMQATVLVALGASPLMFPNGIMHPNIYLYNIYIYMPLIFLIHIYLDPNTVPEGT